MPIDGPMAGSAAIDAGTAPETREGLPDRKMKTARAKDWRFNGGMPAPTAAIPMPG
jgi:hypothetical protein